MRSLIALLQHLRLRLQEFTRYLVLLMLPGGSVLAVTALALRLWPRATGQTNLNRSTARCGSSYCARSRSWLLETPKRSALQYVATS